MTRIKICGINDPAAFDTAIEAGADWIGFVFFPPSPRFVTPDRAARLSERSAGGPPRVGLFVQPTEADVAAVLGAVKLDVLQVYGDAAAIPALKARFGLPVWYAVGVKTPADLPVLAPDGLVPDGFVIEAKPPAGATRPGGNATSFDWDILKDWQAPAPWVLAGGLTPDNVARAIEQTQAPAVDVSSGVERSKGLKDPALIRGFIAAVRGVGDCAAVRGVGDGAAVRWAAGC